MSKKLKSVCFFSNSMVAAFDENGEQVPDLQGALILAWAEKAKDLGYEINGLIIETQMGSKFKILEWEFDGEKGINFEVLR